VLDFWLKIEMDEDKMWIGDQLYEALGYSDRAVEEYVLALGKRCRSVDQVLDKFKEYDLPVSEKTSQFARDLLVRVGKKKNKANTAVKSNADMVRESESYTMLVDDDSKKKKSKKKKKEREELVETEYEKQLREYKEFIGTGEEAQVEAERIKNRHNEKEAEKLKAKEDQDINESKSLRNQFTVEELRQQSRFSYLKKREERELKLLDATIRDEEYLFQGVKLSKREERDLQARKELKNLVENRRELEKKAKGELYAVPGSYVTEDGKIDQEKRNQLLSARYVEETREKSEQDLWEEHQRETAVISKQSHSMQDDYELVLDDEIEFIAHEMMNKPKVDEDMKPTEVDRSLSMSELRKTLPMYQYRTELLQAIRDNQVIIVVAETGSGKTTQIPQYLHEEGWTELGKIGCTQPRRVAAMSVAARVSQEMGVKLGHECGYSIRFEDCTSEKTKIKYMTDGMLMREFLTAPDLAAYSCMMIDEAHERTLATDILFGLLKDVSRYRPDLRLIVSSATLDAQKFSEYFNNAPIFNVPGRMFPVEIFYTKAPEADYLEATVAATLQIHVNQPVPGDILIFLTGQEEIENVRDALLLKTRGLGSKIKELVIRPIYASLPSEEQAKVFFPTPLGARKVVIATNIAETSLTIDGIRFVIDVGFCKQTSYNPKTGVDSLVVTPVSQAGANQRAGRAGRTAAGKCFRLFTAWSFKYELDENTVPEIQRTNLSSVVLQLYSLGINDLIHFDFMDPPPAETLIRSLEQLYALGALNDKGQLTKLGRRMAEFPTDPMLAKTLLAAERYGCVEEVLSICAMLDIGAAVFYRPPEKAVHAETARLNFGRGKGAFGDHMSLRNVYEQWKDTNFSTNWCYENYIQIKSMRKARDIRDQLSGLCDRVELEKLSSDESENIRKAITAGYFYHTAKFTAKDGNSYKTVKNQHTVHMHPSSSLFKEDPQPKWVVYHQLQFTKQEYMRQVIEIKPEWLVEIAPHYYKPADIDDGSKQVKIKSRNAAALQTLPERYQLPK